MADLIGAINGLKKLLQERVENKKKRKSKSSEGDGDIPPDEQQKPWEKEWEHKPNSTWATLFHFIPILFGIARSGAVVMHVKHGRGNPAGYIYPRVRFNVFEEYMIKNARGGAIYWGHGVQPLKEYSVAARRVGKKIVVRGSIGAKQVRMRGIAFPTTKTTKTRKAVTMYRQIPKSVRLHP